MDKKELLKLCGFREDFDENNRVVQQDDVEYQGKTYFVSTVDLGLDHSFGDGPPLYYETMIFERENGDTDWGDLYCNRYTTREEAMKNHRRIIEAFKNNQVSVAEHELEISL